MRPVSIVYYISGAQQVVSLAKINSHLHLLCSSQHFENELAAASKLVLDRAEYKLKYFLSNNCKPVRILATASFAPTPKRCSSSKRDPYLPLQVFESCYFTFTTFCISHMKDERSVCNMEGFVGAVYQLLSSVEMMNKSEALVGKGARSSILHPP